MRDELLRRLDTPESLAIRTRVVRKLVGPCKCCTPVDRPREFGMVVMVSDAASSPGTFTVRWDGTQVYEAGLTISHVTPVSLEQEVALGRPARVPALRRKAG